MKYLCVCEGGNIRSVALATALKDKGPNGKNDAIAVGVKANDKHTVSLLSGWADKIFVMERKLRRYIPNSAQAKVRVCEVGPDTYGDAQHPELVKKVNDFIKKERL